MKTEYNILWIDDNPHNVRGDEKTIRSFLEDHGIELIITTIDTSINTCLTQNKNFEYAVNDISLDMVFVDFNMPEKGDKIIHHIRKNLHHYHLPVLFYTSNGNANASLQQSIIDLNNNEGTNTLNIIDGIYFCDRDHISEKAKNILTSLLKKESLPQQSRGLLMDRVSEIDSKLLQAIDLLWSEVPEEKRSSVVETLKERVIKNSLSSIDKIAKGIENKSYQEILDFFKNDARRWDTNARAIVLRKLLEQLEDKKLISDTLLEFYNESNPKNKHRPLMLMRNDYAHKSSTEIKEDHDDERCKYIRTETRKHINNLDKILVK